MSTSTLSTPAPPTLARPRRARRLLVPLAIAAMALLASSCAPQPTYPTYLTDMNYVSGTTGGANKGPASLNGVTYFRSLYATSSTAHLALHYDLGRRYTRFKSVVGVWDGSRPDTAVWYTVVGDGRTLWSGGTALGVPKAIDIDVRGVLRLELRHVANNSYGRWVWGDARVS